MANRFVWQKFNIGAEISVGPVGYVDVTSGRTGNGGQDKYFDYSYARSKSVRAYYDSEFGYARWELVDPERLSGRQEYGDSTTKISMDDYYWTSYGVGGYGGTLSLSCSKYMGYSYYSTEYRQTDSQEVTAVESKGTLQGYASSASDGAYPADLLFQTPLSCIDNLFNKSNTIEVFFTFDVLRGNFLSCTFCLLI